MLESFAPPTFVIRPSCVAEMREVAMPLLQAHWVESIARKDLLPFDPDWATFEALEANNTLIALAAWRDQQMVGYSASVLVPSHPLSRGFAHAHGVVLYVSPEHRGRHLGSALVKAIENAARERGVAGAVMGAPPGCDLERILQLPRLAYDAIETIYVKAL